MKFNNLTLRILSACFLIPMVLYVNLRSGWLYTLWVFLVTLLIFCEWVSIIQRKKDWQILKRLEWYILGAFYATLFAWSAIFIRSIENGYAVNLWLLISVWSTDVFAYFIGITLKGPKLMPKVSPNKTWSGLIGGIGGALLTSFIFNKIYDFPLVYYGAFIAIAAQAGDLLESKFKRFFGVKNSSNIIPGHGGVMDRVDGLIGAYCIAALYLWIAQ